MTGCAAKAAPALFPRTRLSPHVLLPYPDTRMLLAVPILFALVYLALPTRQYYWDGVAFSIVIEHARSWHDLFNVHHLLYNHIGAAEYQLAGGGIRVLYLLQRTNCVLGGVLIWLSYRLFRSLEVPRNNSVACAALVGASATFWKFTTDADSYILANICLVLAYLGMPRSPVRGAFWHLGAMAMHQLAALFYPVALVLLWRRGRQGFARNAAIYTLISAGGILALYEAAYQLVPSSQTAPTLLAWLTFHAGIPFSFHILDNARWLLLGTARLLVGGKFSRTAFIAGPLALLLCIAAVRHVGQVSDLPKQAKGRSETCPTVVWIAVYLVFLFVWEPYNTFYRLFYLVPLVALLAVRTRHFPAHAIALVAAALFCWNGLQFIYPNSRIENNPPLAVALQQHERWPPGTGVIFAQFVPDLWTISYFNPQVSWITLEHPSAPRVQQLAADFARDGGRIYLDWTYLQSLGQHASRFTFQRVPLAGSGTPATPAAPPH